VNITTSTKLLQVNKKHSKNALIFYLIVSVADPDPGSGIGCFLTPGSGIRDPGSGIGFFRIPDLGSRISDPGSQDHIFKSFLTIFLVKSSIIL
jgi:hypothetical protein